MSPPHWRKTTLLGILLSYKQARSLAKSNETSGPQSREVPQGTHHPLPLAHTELVIVLARYCPGGGQTAVAWLASPRRRGSFSAISSGIDRVSDLYATQRKGLTGNRMFRVRLFPD
jgi:hypothetical protein